MIRAWRDDDWPGRIAGVVLVLFFALMVGGACRAQDRCEDRGGVFIARTWQCVTVDDLPK